MTMLHLFCGQVASGKSTLAAQIAARPGHVLIAQDEWTRHLWPEEMRTLDDYARLIPRLRAALAPHVAQLLRLGMPVVLDWPMNTPQTRAWARGILEAAGADHILHVLRPPDASALPRATPPAPMPTRSRPRRMRRWPVGSSRPPRRKAST